MAGEQAGPETRNEPGVSSRPCTTLKQSNWQKKLAGVVRNERMQGLVIGACEAEHASKHGAKMKPSPRNQPFKVTQRKQPNQTYSRQKKHSDRLQKVVQLNVIHSLVLKLSSEGASGGAGPVSGGCLL